MKVIKNTSMQGIYVAFETPEGPIQRFVAAKDTIQVPDSWGGNPLDNMIRRRMFKVTHTPDSPAPAQPKASNKKPKKSN